MLFSHDDLNNIFLELDQDPEILSCEYMGWLAWPIVKERLWHSLLQTSCKFQNKNKFWINRIKFLIFGMIEFIVNLYAKNYDYLIAYTPNNFFKNDSKKCHAFLGSVIDLDKKFFQVIYQPLQNNKFNFQRGVIHESYLGTFLNLLSLILKFNKKIDILSKKISLQIYQKYPVLASCSLEKTIRRSLSVFYTRKIYYSYLLRNSKIKKCIIQDPDAKCGEVAALKENSIEIIEIQHGMFSCNEPDYSWDEGFLKFKTKMTVPDKILVFGKLWKEMLIKNKFWHMNDVYIIDYPSLSYYRNIKIGQGCKSPEDKKDLTILFPTQYYIQTEALDLLRNFLYLLTQRKELKCSVLIKIHPVEKNFVEYATLANEFPSICKILNPQNNVHEVMIQGVDAVIGYTSMVLLESLGLGIPIVSLKGGHASQGLIKVFNLNLLKDFIPQCSTAEELYTILEEMHIKSNYGMNIQKLWEKIYGEPETTLIEMMN